MSTQDKIKRLDSMAFEAWYAVRHLYLPEERQEILQRVHSLAYNATKTFTDQADTHPYFQFVLAAKKFKYMKQVRKNSRKLMSLADPVSFLEHARESGDPYYPIGDQDHAHDARLEELVQTVKKRAKVLPVKKEYIRKWTQLLDFYSRRDMRQVLIDAFRMGEMTMEYLNEHPKENRKLYKEVLAYWGAFLIEDVHEYTMGYYANDPDPDTTFSYFSPDQEECLQLIVEHYGVQNDKKVA